MKECERLEVVRRVDKIKDKISLLESMSTKYDEMLEDEKVKSFLSLLKEIETLRKELSIYNGDIECMISIEFRETFVNRLENKKMSPCEHDIWIYEGSYYYYEDPRGEHDKFCPCEDENSKDFEHNVYICLECNKKVKVSDYEDFELTHFVLKDKRVSYNIRYFRELYYQFLYSHSFEEAKRLLISEFERGSSRKLDNK